MENWLDISNYDERRTKKLLPVGKNNKVIGLMKDETGGKIITNFFSILATKSYGYWVRKNDHEIKPCQLLKSYGVKQVRI